MKIKDEMKNEEVKLNSAKQLMDDIKKLKQFFQKKQMKKTSFMDQYQKKKLLIFFQKMK